MKIEGFYLHKNILSDLIKNCTKKLQADIFLFYDIVRFRFKSLR